MERPDVRIAVLAALVMALGAPDLGGPQREGRAFPFGRRSGIAGVAAEVPGQAGAGADAGGTGVVKGNAGGNAQSGNSLVISLAWAIRLATPARKSATKAR